MNAFQQEHGSPRNQRSDMRPFIVGQITRIVVASIIICWYQILSLGERHIVRLIDSPPPGGRKPDNSCAT
jgi:hypothetical protein